MPPFFPRYLITITDSSVHVHRCGEERAIVSGAPPKLSPDDVLTLKGREVILDDLSQALICSNQDWINAYLDERGQVEVGHYLYQQIFGKVSPYELAEDGAGVEVRIITKDENIARLPWVLLAHEGVFLSTMGWSVSLSADIQTADYELPPRPKILAVVPQPKTLEATGAEEHLQDIRELLTAADLVYGDDSCFRIVSDLPSFYEELAALQPDILYYYGHGIGDQHATRLLFADQKGRTVETPLPDLAAAFHSLPEHERPKLAYINCCQGDSGGLLGAGRQLLKHIPAVVTNRTTAFMNAARPQALAFWESLLLRGDSPHTALSATRSRLGSLGLTTADIRWMTPVLHCRYERWRANPPILPKDDRSQHDQGNWHLKVDRQVQYSLVSYLIRTMLRTRQVKGYAFLWYGHPEQGLNIFHRRLDVELREELHDTDVYPIFPVWPEEMADPHRSLSEMICKAFEVPTPASIPGRIRTDGCRTAGNPVLVYICHEPLQTPERFHPKYISTYLKWWANEFLPLLPESAFALLGFSYATNQPENFYKALTSDLQPDKLDLGGRGVFEILNELSAVNKEDLHRFLQTHSIHLPSDLRNKVLNDILDCTQGSYLRILEELRNLKNRCYREELEASAMKKDSDNDPWKNAF